MPFFPSPPLVRYSSTSSSVLYKSYTVDTPLQLWILIFLDVYTFQTQADYLFMPIQVNMTQPKGYHHPVLHFPFLLRFLVRVASQWNIAAVSNVMYNC